MKNIGILYFVIIILCAIIMTMACTKDDVECSAGQLTYNGQCVDECPENKYENNGQCVDECPENKYENNGQCVDECPSPLYPSGRSCVESILLRLPVENPNGTMIDDGVYGFDNDLEPGTQNWDCKSYDGFFFPHRYDQHDGSDFMLIGSFSTMDNGSTPIVAAADGEVMETQDGNFDRCHLDIATQYIKCPGYDHITPPNFVKVKHPDETMTWYWHIKKDSIVVEVGDKVKCGDMLGLVGSSGISSAPHLHFEFHLPDGTVVDPFAGTYSHENSYWVNQEGPYGLPEDKCQGIK